MTNRAWIEVDTQQLQHNITTIKQFLLGPTAFALVIKGNAYGHGMQPIAQYCQEHNLVDFFCVAHLSEAIQLRSNNITIPLLVMCTLDAPLSDAIMYEIDISISNFDQLHAINDAAQSLQKKAHVHIKIDTGLSRFGFMPTQIEKLITIIASYTHIIVCGVYSHFAQSHLTDQSYSEKQHQLFNSIVQKIFDAGIRPTYIHQQNSAGIVTQPDPLFSMVRIGALAYGMWSSDFQKTIFERITKQPTIKPILRLKARIIEIKSFASGTPIGYNGIFVTQRPTTVAIIPIGYADGYMRSLGTQEKPAHVCIRGLIAPIIGNIAMNTIIIDVTDIPNVSIGDHVTLIGPDGITPNDLARVLPNGNPREIVTMLSPTLPRIIT